MHPPFDQLLRNLLLEAKMSQREFARRVNRDSGYLNRVAMGRRGPPDRGLETWADRLQLTGQKRDQFLLAAAIARSPKAVQSYIRRLEASEGSGSQ